MNILITGGAGFIGVNFVKYTLKKFPKHKITVLDSLTYAGNKQSLADILDKIDLIENSINNKEVVDYLVSKNDLIINFAAESHNDNSITSPESFINTNIVGVFNLLEATRKHKKRFHHISTDEVFGDLSLDSKEYFNENSNFNPSSPYSASKASSDMLVRAWIRTYNIEATISNCSNNYGPYQHVEKFIPRQITNILINKPLVIYGTGNNIRDWIHVHDHVMGIWAVINKGKIGDTYLLGVDNPMNNIAVIEEIFTQFELPEGSINFVDDRPGHDRKYQIDSTKAIQELDWQPNYLDFSLGIKDTINWYKQNTDWWKEAKILTEEKYRQNNI